MLRHASGMQSIASWARGSFCGGSPRHCVPNLEASDHDVARLRGGDKRHYHSLKPVAFFPTIPALILSSQ